MSAAKTLADMTPEQRDACRGMWCDIFDREPYPRLPVARGIIVGYRETDDGRTLVTIDDPHPETLRWGHELNGISPRPDLPRAWAPDGTPLDVDVEQEIVRPHPRGGLIGGYDNPTYTDLPEGTTVRRFVTEWEPVKEEA